MREDARVESALRRVLMLGDIPTVSELAAEAGLHDQMGGPNNARISQICRSACR